MQDFTLLQGAHPFTRQTRISNTQNEIDAGMKVLGYEPLEIEFETDERLERITHYQLDNIIITFYISHEETVSMKILNLAKGTAKTTRVFHSIAVVDISTVLNVIS